MARAAHKPQGGNIILLRPVDDPTAAACPFEQLRAPPPPPPPPPTVATQRRSALGVEGRSLHNAMARRRLFAAPLPLSSPSLASFLAASPPLRPFAATASTMAVASAFSSPDTSETKAGGGLLGRLTGLRRPRAPSFSFSRPRALSISASSVPSFASSSSSDDGSDAGPRHSKSSRAAGSTRNSSGKAGANERSKLSSARARAAVGLLPSYLLDARSVTKYSPSTPDGALQLSVAENRLCELPVKGLKGIVERTPAGEAFAKAGDKATSERANEDLRLIDVLSLLAKSDVPPPHSDFSSTENVFERDMVYYQPTQGMPGPRKAVASYLDRLLLPSDDSNASNGSSFDPDRLVLGAGCNAVLENLCSVLSDPGDAVLIPAPYYAAFEFDLAARAGCAIVPVTTFDHQNRPPPACGEEISAGWYYPTRSALDHAYDRAAEETGRPPRILLLSHPNNPLGICYPPSVVKECVKWCREREVHLVSDEIYAGSVYRRTREDGSPTFVSAMALAANHRAKHATGGQGAGLGLGPFVHLVYALSKDFALSGLRVGAAYTENDEILTPLHKLNDLCQISSQTQLLVERMTTAEAVVEDGGNEGGEEKTFAEAYLEANASNLRARCDELHATLDELNVPHLRADSGLFAWLDLRRHLSPLPPGVTEATESPESREERERELYSKLTNDYGLLFTPGMSMRCERPGFFRCVFSAASPEEFELGLERLREFARG
ncbi:hypothetical protein ACHAWF_010198 [Thalassiosira exigua]